MKRFMTFAIVSILITNMAQVALACSSFAVYGGNGQIYGMNWDLSLTVQLSKVA